MNNSNEEPKSAPHNYRRISINKEKLQQIAKIKKKERSQQINIDASQTINLEQKQYSAPIFYPPTQLSMIQQFYHQQLLEVQAAQQMMFYQQQQQMDPTKLKPPQLAFRQKQAKEPKKLKIIKFKQKDEDLKAQNSKLNEDLQKEKLLNQDLLTQVNRYEEILQRLKSSDMESQLKTAKVQIVTIVQVFVQLLKYLMSKCVQHQFGGAQSMSNYSQINPRVDFSNSSVTEHMMDRSFEDDRRNMFEQIKSLLIAKLMVIQKTVVGINLQKEIKEVQEWNYDNFPATQQRSGGPKRKSSLVQAPSLKNLNTVRTQNSQKTKQDLINRDEAKSNYFIKSNNMGSFENFDNIQPVENFNQSSQKKASSPKPEKDLFSVTDDFNLERMKKHKSEYENKIVQSKLSQLSQFSSQHKQIQRESSDGLDKTHKLSKLNINFNSFAENKSIDDKNLTKDLKNANYTYRSNIDEKDSIYQPSFFGCQEAMSHQNSVDNWQDPRLKNKSEGGGKHKRINKDRGSVSISESKHHKKGFFGKDGQSKASRSLFNENMSEDDVVSFENFGKLNKSRNEKNDEMVGTLGAVGSMVNDIEQNISESEKFQQTHQENDSENLPIFGHKSSENSDDQNGVWSVDFFKNNKAVSTKNIMKERLNEPCDVIGEHKHGYSFASFGSFKSQNSENQGQLRGEINYPSDNESVELLMMKSAKSAYMDLNQGERSRSGLAKLSKLVKTNKIQKNTKARMESYFRDSESLVDHTKLSDGGDILISRINQSVHSGYSFQQPAEDDKKGSSKSCSSFLHDVEKKEFSHNGSK